MCRSQLLSVLTYKKGNAWSVMVVCTYKELFCNGHSENDIYILQLFFVWNPDHTFDIQYLSLAVIWKSDHCVKDCTMWFIWDRMERLSLSAFICQQINFLFHWLFFVTILHACSITGMHVWCISCSIDPVMRKINSYINCYD